MLDKLLKMASQAKEKASKVQEQLKKEKIVINQKNSDGDPTKPHFNHAENFKEYSSIVNDVYLKDPLKKAKQFIQKEKDIYFAQLKRTFPKETVQQYNQKLKNSMNYFSFWNSNKSQNNNQKSNSSNQSNNYQQTNKQNSYQQYQQGYQSNYYQQNTQQSQQQNKEQGWFNWKSYFNKAKVDAQNLNQKYQENLKEKKTMFESFKEAKLNTFNYVFQNSVNTAKGVGKASFKYILIGVFVFGFAYSIPKAISNFFATKAAISAQMQIENLKQENEALKKENEFLKNNIRSLMGINVTQFDNQQKFNLNDQK